MSLILICHPFHASRSVIGQVPAHAETRPPRGGEVDPTAPFHASRSASGSSTGRTRSPRGGEVDPTAPFHASRSALLSQLKPFTLRRY
ncbi:hypothetical protein V6N13_029258 [Hibiscus sabdariffa]